VIPSSGLYLPNRIARAFFLVLDDVMGSSGLETLLSRAGLATYYEQFPPDNLDRNFDVAHMSALQMALEELYGPYGGRGMARQIGRGAFATGIKQFGIMRAIADPAFRARDLDDRAVLGLQALASIYTSFSDQPAEVDASLPLRPTFIVYNSPYAWGRTSDRPVCYAQVGLLVETLRWATDGHMYQIRETACIACGDDHCVYSITHAAGGDAPGTGGQG
jgi:hypothetical protein